MDSPHANGPSPDSHPEESITDRPAPRRAREEPDDEDDRPRLGSLAQKARGNQLNQARGILIAIGVLTVGFNLVEMLTAAESLRREVRTQAPNLASSVVQQIVDQHVPLVYALDGAFIAVGVLFIVLGALVKAFPVPVTITGLVLYLLGSVAQIAIALQGDGSQLINAGWIFRVLCIAALARSINAALVYERERGAPRLDAPRFDPREAVP